jgi:uncharacterized protein (TIGR01319 family)
MIEHDLHTILATDCGSTTTKAILIEKRGDNYQLVVRGEAPTTVEAPYEDVTCGVLNAIMEVEELSGRKILDGETIITPEQDGLGVDIYLSTSSAGGGLQMMVAGVVKNMTAESAERAALGAGAIVMDVLASNDRRLPHEKIQRLRSLRPDMILLSGGIDGGTVKHVVEIAEILRAANLRPRLGSQYNLPVIYAGNSEARDQVHETLDSKADVSIVDNLRPTMEEENLGPGREKIHDLFMEHVMAQAPGYGKLKTWVKAPIMPTPAAVGNMIRAVAKEHGNNVIGVDIGGATTDMFSDFGGVFNRTVSANLGMSYSIANVLAEAGYESILRWVPLDVDEADLKDRIGNKMIRPTTIPQTMEELIVEQALAREALRLSFEQHRAFATELKGVQKRRTISDTFEQDGIAAVVNLQALDLLIGSGGVLSHAPRRAQTALMLIDSFQPELVTELAVDSIFMMPQLGVLADVHRKAATEVFHRDCLIRLGACLAPTGKYAHGKPCLRVQGTLPDGQTIDETLQWGDLKLIAYHSTEPVELQVEPMKNVHLGADTKGPQTVTMTGGEVGLILDCRGRPIVVPADTAARRQQLSQWYTEMGMYE